MWENILVNLKQEKGMAMEFVHIVMVHIIKVTFKMINAMAKDYMSSQMVTLMMGLG